MLSENPFKQLETKPCESVSLGNHNLSDCSLKHSLQNPLEAPAFEVDSASDVGDDTVTGVLGLEVLNLSIKISLLLPRRTTSVDDLLWDVLTTVGFIGCGRGEGVSSMTAFGGDIFDFSSETPVSESLFRDTIVF